MPETIHITDPSQLSDVDVRLARLHVEDAPAQPNDQHVTLALLQPLTTDEMLGPCRNPESMVTRFQDGTVCGPSNLELLKLEPLSTAWRKAAKETAPISHVTFDLTLPDVPCEDASSKTSRIYWETQPPQQGGICVVTRDVMGLVITLATAARARATGEMSFGLEFDKAQRPSELGMERLRKQLEVLAKYEPSKC